MRGYARAKSYEADPPWSVFTALSSALSDFQQCKKLDPNYSKADAAIEKITRRRRQAAKESLVDVVGSIVIFLAACLVFVLAQLIFLTEKNATIYTSLTFGSLLFMIAGLYLPKVLKLKLPGIELEKASVGQVSRALNSGHQLRIVNSNPERLVASTSSPHRLEKRTYLRVRRQSPASIRPPREPTRNFFLSSSLHLYLPSRSPYLSA